MLTRISLRRSFDPLRTLSMNHPNQCTGSVTV